MNNERVKAYAAWELEYRAAYDISDLPEPEFKRHGDGRKVEELFEQRMEPTR